MTMTTWTGPSSRGFLPTPLARIGLIIPSSNRLTEPQLRHFAPPELGIHVTRLQMTGKWNRPLSALTEDIQRAASALADAKVRHHRVPLHRPRHGGGARRRRAHPRADQERDRHRGDLDGLRHPGGARRA